MPEPCCLKPQGFRVELGITKKDNLWDYFAKEDVQKIQNAEMPFVVLKIDVFYVTNFSFVLYLKKYEREV